MSSSNEEFEVEDIIDKRKRGKNVQYLVKWVGYDKSENSWEPARNLSGSKEKINEYNRRIHNAKKQNKTGSAAPAQRKISLLPKQNIASTSGTRRRAQPTARTSVSPEVEETDNDKEESPEIIESPKSRTASYIPKAGLAAKPVQRRMATRRGIFDSASSSEEETILAKRARAKSPSLSTIRSPSESITDKQPIRSKANVKKAQWTPVAKMTDDEGSSDEEERGIDKVEEASGSNKEAEVSEAADSEQSSVGGSSIAEDNVDSEKIAENEKLLMQILNSDNAVPPQKEISEPEIRQIVKHNGGISITGIALMGGKKYCIVNVDLNGTLFEFRALATELCKNDYVKPMVMKKFEEEWKNIGSAVFC